MSTEKTICEKCGKERRSEMQSSFTQWIFDRNSCGCDAPHNEAKPAPSSTQFCDKCGRPTVLPREGSMTQWIFRSVPCSCSESETAADSSDIGQSTDSSEVDEWAELPLDPKHFPIDRYKPIEELGAGTSGKVYLCVDRLLRKKVAVKTLRTLSKEQFLAFQTEARATSRLNHPAILNLLDFGPTEGGEPYMVLEYFDSQTLTNFIRANGSINARTVQQIFMPIISALTMSHREGIFHRDLKPQNILISSAENQFEVKLIDFGTATVTAFAEAGQSTQSTSLVGTPAYMAPDCASGLPYDARSEIYSLGCVIFECLAGQPPFEGNTPVELLSQHANTPAPNLQEFDIECPDSVADMVSRCLEKDREDRFQSMEELAETLAGLNLSSVESTAEEQVAPVAVDVIASKSEDDGKNRNRLLLLGTLATALVVLGVGVASKVFKEEDEPTVAPMNMVKIQSSGKGPEYPERFTDAHLKAMLRSGKQYPRLNLENTQISADGLRLLSKEPIKELAIGSTPIDVQTAFPILAKMKQLESLGIAALHVDNKNILLLKGMRLRSLNLAKNQGINNDSIPIIARLFPDLRGLYIEKTSVTNEGICRLKLLKNLRGVNLSQLEIDDSCLECLTTIPLRSVEIHFSPITSKGFLTLAMIPSLKVIKLLGTVNVTMEAEAQMNKIRPDIRVVMDDPGRDIANEKKYAEK